MTELALELRDLGHDVTVVTTTPHYNVDVETRARQPLRRRWGGLLYQSECGGIPVYHAAVRRKGSRVIRRAFDYARFHGIGLAAGLAFCRDFDVVLAPSPPLTIGIQAWLLARARKAAFVYNVQEIYPDIAVHMGVLRNPALIRAASALERFVYRRSDRIVAISEEFRRNLTSRGVGREKVEVIPNFVDTEFITPVARRNGFSAENGLDGRFVVLYAGNLGLTQDFEGLLLSAKRLEILPDVRFVVVGDGATRPWLQAELQRRAIQNVILLPYQPRSTVPEIYGTSDVCIIPMKRGTTRDTFPSKIYTIMAAGRPVIAATESNSELGRVVREADCGEVVAPEDSEAFTAAIERAYSDRPASIRRGHNGRKFVLAKHSRKTVALRYDALIRELAHRA